MPQRYDSTLAELQAVCLHDYRRRFPFIFLPSSNIWTCGCPADQAHVEQMKLSFEQPGKSHACQQRYISCGV